MGIFTFHNMGPLSQILALLLSLAFDLHRLLREISGSLAALLVANCLCLFFLCHSGSLQWGFFGAFSH